MGTAAASSRYLMAGWAVAAMGSVWRLWGQACVVAVMLDSRGVEYLGGLLTNKARDESAAAMNSCLAGWGRVDECGSCCPVAREGNRRLTYGGTGAELHLT